MIDKLKWVFAWISNNLYKVLIILGIIIVSILSAFLFFKSKSVSKLKNELVIQQAKAKIQRTTDKYDSGMKNIEELRKTESELDNKLKDIEKTLKDKLSSTMTGEEIVEAFKKHGIPVCD